MRDINSAFKLRRPPPERFERTRLPEAVQGILESAFRKFGIKEELSKYQFVLHWRAIVGDDIAKRTKPESLKNKTLVIRVTDSTWSQELVFHKELIIKRLNSFLKSQAVDNVLFVVGSV